MSKEERSFEKVRYVGWETSMSPIVEREKKTMKYHVCWIKDEERGWWELYDKESGGDDYQLCFTVPAGSVKSVNTLIATGDLISTKIGEIVKGTGVECVLQGKTFDIDVTGYQHF